MVLKTSLGVLVVIVGFLLYVTTRQGQFHYERSGLINAPAEQIFPYLKSFKLASQWSPYEKMDPVMKKSIVGEDGQIGAKMEFESQAAGSGSIEILQLVPSELVKLRLRMTLPFRADNSIEYKLTPEDQGTRMTWSMSGDGGFMTKLLSVFIDCDKMVGEQFSLGIENLKALIEGKT